MSDPTKVNLELTREELARLALGEKVEKIVFSDALPYVVTVWPPKRF